MKLIAVLLALAPTTPVPGRQAATSDQRSTASPGARPAVTAQARRMAELYLAEDAARQNAAREFRKTFLAEINAAPQVVALDKANPGMIDAALNAGLAQLNASYGEAIPRVRESLAAFFAANFTAPEMALAIAFYDSPAGRRTMQTAGDATDSTPILKTMQKEARTSFNEADLQTLITPGVASVIASEDGDAFSAFMASAAGLKFQKVGPQLFTLLASQMTAEVQKLVPEVQLAATRALQAHLKAAAAKAP